MNEVSPRRALLAGVSCCLKSKGRRVAAAMCVAMLMGVGIWYANHREPRYQERTLSSWLMDIAESDPAKQRSAQAAIRQMGTNSLPWLVKYISEPESPRLEELRLRASLYSVPECFLPSPPRRDKALTALEGLGPAATPAIPLLMAKVDQPPHYAAMALGGLGTNALPELLKVLQSTNAQVVHHAAMGFSVIGPQPLPAAFVTEAEPLFIAMLQHTNSTIRESGTLGLYALGPLSTNAVAASVAMLAHADFKVRMDAVTCISLCSEWAPDARPALQQAMQDPDTRVSQLARYCYETSTNNVSSKEKPKPE